jgi:hypothetical protein
MSRPVFRVAANILKMPPKNEAADLKYGEGLHRMDIHCRTQIGLLWPRQPIHWCASPHRLEHGIDLCFAWIGIRPAQTLTRGA